VLETCILDQRVYIGHLRFNVFCRRLPPYRVFRWWVSKLTHYQSFRHVIISAIVETMVFSIIVPTCERRQHLEVLLAALERLEFAREAFEVIVVDDGGSCNPHQLRVRFTSLNLRVVTQEHDGPAQARNRGAACAMGRYLAFTDDDCVPDRNWLNEFLAALERFPDHLIGGPVLNGAGDNPFSGASQHICDCLHSHFNGDQWWRPRFFLSSNIALSARLFQFAEGFHSAFSVAGGEDREFCHRWLGLGFGLTYAPGAIVHHNQRLTFRSYWRQQFNYGRGARIFRRMAQQSGQPVPFEPIAFYWRLLVSPAQESRTAGRMFLVALSQLAVASGYIREIFSKGAYTPADAQAGVAVTSEFNR
jgi:GT2 family glycosyltransferase